MKISLKSKAAIINGSYISIQTLIDKVQHPRRYDHVIGVPGAFDAAEYLLNNHYAALDTKTSKKVLSILEKSGKYKIETV